MFAIAPLIDPAHFDLHGNLWLAHCKDGPIPRVAVSAAETVLRQELRPDTLRWQEDFLDVMQGLRENAATLFGVHASDVSLVTCTSTGLEAIALGYPWQADDEVLLPRGEFPSNRLPWLALAARGVRCREVALWDEDTPDVSIAPEQRLIDAMGPRTRLLAVSWIRFQDGIRLDLDRLGRACRARGVHLVVDGIQGTGTMSPSLDGVSAFASGGHKGLLGEQGQGLLWTDPALRRSLLPLGTWMAEPDDPAADDPWVSDGRRLEAGSPSLIGVAMLAASTRLLLDHGGTAAIARHVTALQRELLGRLAEDPAWREEAQRLLALVDADRVGPTLCFRLPQATIDSLLDTARSLRIGASSRQGYLRIAWHGWHGSADVARCVDWLAG